MATARPEIPSTAFLDQLAREEERAVQRTAPLTSSHAGAPDDLAGRLTRTVEGRGDDLLALSHDLHAHPEVGFEEHRSVRAVAELLEGSGHEAEVGAYGLPTALRAVAGEGAPRLAVLAEYDALPGIGHGCGHNIICTTAVGAFLALAEYVGELGGTVELIGTPAEEGGGGKELIARAGGFNGVDAAIMLHPSGHDLAAQSFLGRRVVEAVYTGVAAHASASPFMGRNALDAVVSAYTGIAALRQHIPPTDRIHGVITDGGARPNVVPERAAAEFYVRSAGIETLLDLSRRVEAIFEGAATMTGTGVEVRWDGEPAYLPVRYNRALAARYAERMAVRGRRPLPEGVVPEFLTGSTDLGNVSVRVPSIHPMLAVAPSSVALHTSQFARWAATEQADAALVDGAVGLALTGADFLADPALREDAAREFADAGGPVDVANLFAG
ncbi:MAG: amidohydrolase [Streptosporangiales bacterium]|nr:amidohydrolase [Streptosporangiales bacterium]